MRHLMRSFVVLSIVAIVMSFSMAHAQQLEPRIQMQAVTQEELQVLEAEAARNNQIVFWFGLTLDVDDGTIMVDMRPVLMDPQDIGKPLAEIQNPVAREDIKQAYREMWQHIGTADNARRVAASALQEYRLTARAGGPSITEKMERSARSLENQAVRDRVIAGFEKKFRDMETNNFALSGRVDKPKSCKLGDICPYVCGTKWVVGGLVFCGDACVSCGSMS